MRRIPIRRVLVLQVCSAVQELNGVYATGEGHEEDGE